MLEEESNGLLRNHTYDLSWLLLFIQYGIFSGNRLKYESIVVDRNNATDGLPHFLSSNRLVDSAIFGRLHFAAT